MLAAAEYTMKPTGALLNEGLAPMGGEIEQGGMQRNGVNQKRLSVETVRDMGRSWRYATTISNSFDPEKYANPDSLFGEILGSLKGLTPDCDNWDILIIKMNRLKQWNPEAFSSLVAKYGKEIQCLKKESLKGCVEKEILIKEALEYDPERAKLAVTDVQVREEIEKKFSPHLTGWMGTKWYEMDEFAPYDSFNFFCIGDKFGYAFDREFSGIIMHILRYKICGETQYINMQREVDEEECQVAQFILRKVGPDFKPDKFLDIFILPKLENRIGQVMHSFQRRYQRMLNVFDTPPKMHLSESERQLISKPFPILFASARSRSASQGLQEYQIRQAKLGEDIDLIFVKKEHVMPMREWLKQHGLEKSVVVHTYDSLPLTEFPLYHAPHQVLSKKPFLNAMAQKGANSGLNAHIFPLYAPTQISHHAYIME